MNKKLKIGITDCGAKYPVYENWILSEMADIQVIKLSYSLNNFDEIKNCDGILLTGGEDINPNYYQKPEYISLCNPAFMDEKRDEFEWKICEYIFQHKLPVLGICRGLQLVNVFLGGTLIPDIPTYNKSNHSKFYEGKDRYHTVDIVPNSNLSKITNLAVGTINSAHHQSADLVANSLIINALSENKIIEGLEWKDRKNKQFLMLVQWHPERLDDLKGSLSSGIRKAFIEALKFAV